MSTGDMPRVCANCKWAELVNHECQGVTFDVKCHRHSIYHPHDLNGWCGDFSSAWGLREMRYDLPYPPYQRRPEVDRGGR